MLEVFRQCCSQAVKAKSNNFLKLNHINKFSYYALIVSYFIIMYIINYASSRT